MKRCFYLRAYAQMMARDAVQERNVFFPGGPYTAIKHLIESGDTLTGISAEYNTSIDVMQVLNSIMDLNDIYAGNTLAVIENLTEVDWLVEALGYTLEEPETEYETGLPTEVGAAKLIQHQMLPGQTLASVAVQYGVTEDAIRNQNLGAFNASGRFVGNAPSEYGTIYVPVMDGSDLELAEGNADGSNILDITYLRRILSSDTQEQLWDAHRRGNLTSKIVELFGNRVLRRRIVVGGVLTTISALTALCSGQSNNVPQNIQITRLSMTLRAEALGVIETEEAKKPSLDLEDYVEFESFNWKPGNESFWEPDDIALVTADMEQAIDLYGILYGGRANALQQLFPKAKNGVKVRLEKGHCKTLKASACVPRYDEEDPDFIRFTQNYFNKGGSVHTVIHELAHFMDFHDDFYHSTSWEFAQYVDKHCPEQPIATFYAGGYYYNLFEQGTPITETSETVMIEHFAEVMAFFVTHVTGVSQANNTDLWSNELDATDQSYCSGGSEADRYSWLVRYFQRVNPNLDSSKLHKW